MSFSDTFIQAIDEIKNNGMESAPRGIKVKETMLAQIDINPYYPIANFPDREFNWKYFAGEMAWYLMKDRDVDYISQFSSFWKDITNPDSNQINSNYGSLVLNEQLLWVVDNLKQDPNSRQAVMFFNRPDFQFKGNKDFVCTMYANFFIRANALHMKVQMRSNDIFYGLTFDAPFFSFLQQSVYLLMKEQMPDLQLGGYYHNADNLHYYERHFDLADSIKLKGKAADKSLILKDKFIDIVDGNVVLTSNAERFIDQVNTAVANKSDVSAYYNILSEHFELEPRTNG